jgi:hypothetical protein
MRSLSMFPLALVFLVCARGAWADTYSEGMLNIPTLAIGNATFSSVVVTPGSILDIQGGEPQGAVDTYDPASNQLFIPSVFVGNGLYTNVLITVNSLVSIGSVSGADTYAGAQLTSPSIQMQGGGVYTNVVLTVGHVISAGGGMPLHVRDVYDPASHELTIAAVQLGNKVYTNAVITPGIVHSIGTPYSIGGTTSGLAAPGLVLQDNFGDNLGVAASTFIFPIPLGAGARYSVSVLSQPTGQTCTVANGSGTVGTGNIVNVAVSCSFDQPLVCTAYSGGGTDVDELWLLPLGTDGIKLVLTNSTASQEQMGLLGPWNAQSDALYDGSHYTGSLQVTVWALTSNYGYWPQSWQGYPMGVAPAFFAPGPGFYSVNQIFVGLAGTSLWPGPLSLQSPPVGQYCMALVMQEDMVQGSCSGQQLGYCNVSMWKLPWNSPSGAMTFTYP